jgi:hypothetical protein
MEKTIQFWDDQHGQDAAFQKEWIYTSSDQLFHLIFDPLVAQRLHRESENDGSNNRQNTTTIHVLEIGCGTSTLASDLCEFWNRTFSESSPFLRVNIVATDAIRVCIEQQRARKNQYPDQCRYEVWNVLEAPQPAEQQQQQWQYFFDVVLDKGCVDTILFRAKKGAELAKLALANIKNCLRLGSTSSTAVSRYCVITSRKKYRKYLSVVFLEHHISSQRLDMSQKGDATIVTQERNGDRVYLYVCTTDDNNSCSGAGTSESITRVDDHNNETA